MAKFICGLNLRTDRLEASLAKVDNNKIDEIHSYYCLSKGIDINGVANISVLIGSVNNIFNQFKNSVQEAKTNNVFVALDSVFVNKVVSKAAIPLLERGSKIITASDIKKVTSFAKAFAQRLDEELIYSIPLEFMVDDQIISKDPLGLYAHKLEIRLLCLLASRNLLDNVTYAFRCAGLEVNNFFYAPFLLSFNLDEEKRKNCVFINFGKHFTDLLFYKDGLLEGIEILKMGSQDVVEALTKELDVPITTAQELKDTRIVLDAELSDNNSEEILIKRFGDYQSIKRNQINKVANFVFIGQFQRIKEELLKYSHLVPENKIFITGDDVFLDGFLELFSKTLNISAQILSPLNHKKAAYKGHPQMYCPSLGSLQFALFDHQKNGSLSFHGKKLIRNGLAYIKELYQEYF